MLGAALELAAAELGAAPEPELGGPELGGLYLAESAPLDDLETLSLDELVRSVQNDLDLEG